MFFLAGDAATSALDLISKLQQSLASRVGGAQTSSNTQGTTASPFDLGAPTDTSAAATGAGGTQGGTQIAPNTMGALLSAQGQQTTLVNGDAFSQKLFSLLDTNSDGSISKNEFETAFGQNGNTTLADSIFAKLDANGDGSVNPTELTNALDGAAQGMQQAHHHHHHGGFDMSGMGQSSTTNASGGGSTDPLMQLGKSQTTTNADGSTTTTISYADGSQVSMTAPAGNGSSTGASPSNPIERMIQRQAQMLASAATGQSLTMNV
jgi:hypothetical protein